MRLPPYLILHFLLVLRGERYNTSVRQILVWIPVFLDTQRNIFATHVLARRLSPRAKGFSITVEDVVWKAQSTDSKHSRSFLPGCHAFPGSLHTIPLLEGLPSPTKLGQEASSQRECTGTCCRLQLPYHICASTTGQEVCWAGDTQPFPLTLYATVWGPAFLLQFVFHAIE